MSVRGRLWIAFAVVIGVVLVPVLYAGARLGDLREMAVERRSEHAAAVLALGQLQTELNDYDHLQRAYLAALDTRIGASVEASIQSLDAELDRLSRAGYRAQAEALARGVDSLATISREIDRRIAAGEVEAATRTYDAVAGVRGHLSRQADTVAAAIDRRSREDFERAEALSETAATTTIATTLVAVLLGLLVGGWTTRTLTGPLRDLTRAAGRVEGGTLEAPDDLPYGRADEIGELSRSFRAMTNHLAELDRQKAEFMSVASHELKTPIAAVRANADLLLLDADEMLTDPQEQALERIIEQTQVLVRLVHRLLDIGRLEAGTYPLEIESVEVRGMLDEVTRTFGVLAEERGIRLEVVAEDTTPGAIPADADLLRNEVLGNLLSNALRFTPTGGEIRLSAWGEAEHVVFEVSDTGPGVPEEKRDHIFEKYYEGGRRRFMGAGLGLAVVKEVVEAHGGRVTLEPPDDRGATFRVYVPRSREEA